MLFEIIELEPGLFAEMGIIDNISALAFPAVHHLVP
jgi:hypothetical protein